MARQRPRPAPHRWRLLRQQMRPLQEFESFWYSKVLILKGEAARPRRVPADDRGYGDTGRIGIRCFPIICLLDMIGYTISAGFTGSFRQPHETGAARNWPHRPVSASHRPASRSRTTLLTAIAAATTTSTMTST
jgi:hypothetical protein